ncbi:Gfo/Idh/MocA family protein [Agromyces aerolatus]|uniref:Gfo/Idh/MocA family protein n=1 Tax=Agromyces sp. LY-1074 TaxID=3074080 RepID=UPI00285870B4|nr:MULTISPECIES: Gfo/Idh/MocA family oxidoreductase [unclassified Agromyces]MDR5699531.1 Gfo/Idh/MocA family oxidoreductase [Agromyces sp. LY-1074]MDR5705827.1 Gfo/Idh/MocA family oxidoreductase [Agromyces sp. LY-1358]
MERRVGVLGMGRWGEAWCRVLGGEPSATVATVAGRRAVGRTDLGDARRVAHFREAIELGGLDAVIVTLPIELHLPAIRVAVARGVPVLCEKPLVPNRRHLQEVAEVAAAASTPVLVDQNYRFRPWARAVREHLPAIGRLEEVRIRFAQPEFTDGGRARLAHPLLADMAIHHLDLLRFLTGAEATVRSVTAARPDDCAYEGLASVDAGLELDGGARVSYEATWAARRELTPWDGDWVFRGRDGELRVSDLAVDLHLDSGEEPRRVATTRPPQADEDLGVAWRDFVAACEGDSSAGITVADNVRSMNLVFDLAEAAGVPDPSAPVGSR